MTVHDLVIEAEREGNASREAIATYDATVAPLMERTRANLMQSPTLTTLRDTLLPRLISGQLRLPEATAIVDEALA